MNFENIAIQDALKYFRNQQAIFHFVIIEICLWKQKQIAMIVW